MGSWAHFQLCDGFHTASPTCLFPLPEGRCRHPLQADARKRLQGKASWGQTERATAVQMKQSRDQLRAS